MLYLGVDPGKQGAIAAVSPDSQVAMTHPTPLVTAARGGREEFDLASIVRLLRGLGPEVFVTVERSQPIPPTVKAGGNAQFARGVARGWEWMLAALGLPYQLVAPQAWQKAMHLGTAGEDTKQRSIVAAQRLFPLVDLRRSERCRVAHDGIAEALLLAEYGRRTHGGTEISPVGTEGRR